MNLFEKFKKDMQEKQIMKQEGSFSLLLIGSIVQACFKKYMKKHYDFELASAVILTENHWGSVFFDYDGYTRCTHETFNKYRNLKYRDDSFLISRLTNPKYILYIFLLFFWAYF